MLELIHYIYGDSTNVAWNPFMAVETVPERLHLHMRPIPADTFLNVTTEATASFTITNLSGEQLLEGTLRVRCVNRFPIQKDGSAAWFQPSQ